MYGPNLKVVIARRDVVGGEPLERCELPLTDGTKNVLLVLKVDPVKGTPDVIQAASEWLGEQCTKMSGRTVSYHGVVIFDTADITLDVVEVEEITLS